MPTSAALQAQIGNKRLFSDAVTFNVLCVLISVCAVLLLLPKRYADPAKQFLQCGPAQCTLSDHCALVISVYSLTLVDCDFISK